MNRQARLRDHPALRAGTVHEAPEQTPTCQPFEYPRGRGRAPFRVTHHPLEHRPYGIFRVSVDGGVIGRQLSRPTPDDCARMEREAGA